MDFTGKRSFLRTSCWLFAVTLAVSLMSTALMASGPWQVLGPDGGDARSLAYDAHNPDHILLGTSTGQMFSSDDGGKTWSRLARLGGDEYVLDHISIDPQNSNHIYVSAWSSSGRWRCTRVIPMCWSPVPSTAFTAAKMAAIPGNVSRPPTPPTSRTLNR